MWTPLRAVIVEDEPLSARYLATLLDETCQVQVVGTASAAAPALTLCTEQRPDAAFVDVCLPGQDGVSLATQLNMLPQPPRLVFTTGQADHAANAFRLDAVDYLLKPLDPAQVAEAVKRLVGLLRPFELNPRTVSDRTGTVANEANSTFDLSAASNLRGELLPVRDADRDQIRLLARREIVAVLRRERRTWVHTVREEFATYYPLAQLVGWLGGEPFLQVARDAVVNLRAVDLVHHYGDRLYRLRMRDRPGSEVNASRTGAVRLAAALRGK